MKKFTVISVHADNGQNHISHVEAEDGQKAFLVVAKEIDGLELVASVPGHLFESKGEIHLPGTAVVDSETVLSEDGNFGTTTGRLIL